MFCLVKMRFNFSGGRKPLSQSRLCAEKYFVSDSVILFFSKKSCLSCRRRADIPYHGDDDSRHLSSTIVVFFLNILF